MCEHQCKQKPQIDEFQLQRDALCYHVAYRIAEQVRVSSIKSGWEGSTKEI